MARFTNSSSGRKKSPYQNLLLSVLIFAAVITVFLYALGKMSEKTTAEQEKSLIEALNRGVVQCYAAEGSYPENLDYLKSHYGISYDETHFFVDYSPRGQNIMPDITVIRKE